MTAIHLEYYDFAMILQYDRLPVLLSSVLPNYSLSRDEEAGPYA